MKWLGTLALLAAVLYSSRAEQSASGDNTLPRPVGVVYLLELLSAPREQAPAFDDELSNVIPESTINSQKHTYLLIRPFSKGNVENADYQESYRASSPKYLIRQRREAHEGKSGGGGFGGGGGGGGGGGFGGGFGGGGGGGKGGGFGGGGGKGGGFGGGGGLGGGGGNYGGGGHGGQGGGGSHGGGYGGQGGGGHGGGGHGGGGGAHSSASASASAHSSGYGK